MRKILIILFVLLGLSLFTTNAQTKIVLNGGIQVPTGDLKDATNASTGFGGSAEGEFTISTTSTSSIALTVALGYNNWSIDLPATAPAGASLSIHASTFMGGIKFFFNQFYVGGALGFGTPGFTASGFGVTEIADLDSKFMWAPTVGVRINNFDVNAKYQSISTDGPALTWFGINVGYAFGL